MSIVLKKNITLKNYEVLVEYSEFEEKKLLHATIEYIHEQIQMGHKNENEIIKGISRDLLFGSKLEAFARRMFYELFQGNYIEVNDSTVHITTMGEIFRKDGDFKVQYQDVLSVQVLLNSPIISDKVVRLQDLHDNVKRKLKDAIQYLKKKERKKGVSTPKLDEIDLQSISGKEFNLFDNKKIVIDKIGDYGKVKGKKNVLIELKLSESSILLKLIDKNEELDFSRELHKKFPEITYRNVLQKMIEDNGFIVEDDVVKLSKKQYEGMKNVPLVKNMERNMEFMPRIKFGDEAVDFKKTTLKLKFYPIDKSCANVWAKDMLVSLINRYINEDEYYSLQKTVVEQFNDIGVELPNYLDAPTDLDLNMEEKTYWYLQASIDLGMEVLQ